MHARVPRVCCPVHGVHQVAVPWTEPCARFTVLFERPAMDVLRGADGDARLGALARAQDVRVSCAKDRTAASRWRVTASSSA